MDSLENKIYQYLMKREDRARIHVTEITGTISAPIEQIKRELLNLTKTFPDLGTFDYLTGWIERKLTLNYKRDKNIMAPFIFSIGVIFSLGIFLGSIGYLLWLTGLAILCYAIVYSLNFIKYDETRREVIRIRSLNKHHLRLQ